MGLPHCQHVTVTVNIFQHLTLNKGISDSNVRNVCCDVLSPDIYKTQQSNPFEIMEQRDNRLLKSVCCAVRRIPVDEFVDESYSTCMLTFMNRKAHFVLHNSHCSSSPTERHSAIFLYSTFNTLCDSLNRLFTV